MHRFLGFLSTMILFIEMINYAHADEGGEDAEELQTRAVITSKAESFSLESAHWDSMQGTREIETLKAKMDNAGVVDSSRVEPIRVLAYSGYAENGLQTMPDSLSVKTSKRDGRGISKRIVKKLGGGVLGGSGGAVLGAVLGAIGTGGGGAADGVPLVLGGLFGYMAGTAVGVTWVDPRDHFISTLLGSLIGMVVGLKEMSNHFHIEKWSESWPVFAYPVIGATTMSELSRYIPASSHLSLGMAPDRRGRMSAVVALRF